MVRTVQISLQPTPDKCLHVACHSSIHLAGFKDPLKTGKRQTITLTLVNIAPQKKLPQSQRQQSSPRQSQVKSEH